MNSLDGTRSPSHTGQATVFQLRFLGTVPAWHTGAKTKRLGEVCWCFMWRDEALQTEWHNCSSLLTENPTVRARCLSTFGTPRETDSSVPGCLTVSANDKAVYLVAYEEDRGMVHPQGYLGLGLW